jgi:hypothetical protein
LRRSVRSSDSTAATEERAWDVVQAVYAERQLAPQRRRRARLALVPLVAVVVGVLALTPAGAAVHRWIDQTLGVRHASRELFSLPAPGRILVSGSGGTWTISADGAKRRLGRWQQASWSALGKYVVVAARDELEAIDTRGVPQWAIARPDVRFPRWYAPNGYRIAYLSGATLRVIAGDAQGDRRLAVRVAPVAPTWRSGHEYQLAYAGGGGAIVVRDADTGQVQWSRRLASGPRLLRWSADGSRLLAVTGAAAYVYGGSGRPLARVALAPNGSPRDAALSPDGKTLALLDGRGVTLTTLPPLRRSTRVLFSGDGLRQLAWSPDGQWLLVSWPAADQWIFIRATGTPRIVAASRIAEQVAAGRNGHGFPRIEGWCCTAAGGAG